MMPTSASQPADRPVPVPEVPRPRTAARRAAASLVAAGLSIAATLVTAATPGGSPDPAPIIVGCAADDAPLSAQTPGDVPRGLLIDLWRLWARSAGQPIEFQCHPAAQLIAELTAGRVTVHAGLLPRPDLDAVLAYGEPLYPVSTALVGRRDLGSPPNLDARTIGVLHGSPQVPLAPTAFPRAHVVRLDTHAHLLDALARGTLDAALTGTLAAAALASRPELGGRFTVDDSRYLEGHLRPAVRRADHPLLDGVGRGFANLDADAVSALEKRWIADPDLRRLSNRHRGIALTSAERAFVAAHPVVRFGLMGTDWAPVEMVEPDGTVTGITPAFRDLVAARLGIRFDLVVAKDWTDLDGRLQRREVDVTGSLADAPARRGYLTTTRPYLTGELGIVTRADDLSVSALADLSGRRLALESGYATTLWVERNFPAAAIVPFPDTPAALRAVSEGRADAYLGSVMTTTHAIRQLLLSNLRVIGTNDVFPFELRFGVRSDWPELASMLDKAVASLSPAERTAIRDRWVSATVVEKRDWARVLLVVVPSFAALTVLIGAVILWNRRLRREIDQRQAAQAALAEQIAFRSALLDALPEPVVFKDSTGRYLGCNRAFEEFYGVRRAELVGRLPTETKHLDAALQAQVTAADGPVLAGGETRTVRMRTRRSDGATRDILYSLSALPRADPHTPSGGIVGVIVDVTELESARAQAYAAEALLRDITDTAPGVVWRYVSRPGERGRFSFVSAGIRDLHGIAPQEAVDDARVVFGTMVEPDRSALISRINAPAGDPALLQTEYRSRLPDGTTKWLSVRAQPRLQPDGSVLWDGTAFDITDEKRLQAELAEARTAAETANLAKSRFLAKISHEIRTPLAGMIGMLRLLRATPRPADPERLMGLVEASAEGLLRVLNDILDISKIEAGRLTIERTAFDLAAVTDQAVAMAASLRGVKPVEVTLARSPDLPRFVLGDALRVRQILDNLLSNAVKFTERGEVTLSVVPDGSDAVRFEVRDTGMGFDDTVRDSLFRPYEQAGPETARRYGGTGLGLAICRELAALMGGRIGAEGEKGRGACFWFSLPLPASAAPDRPDGAAQPEGVILFEPPDAVTARSAGVVVLVADDDDIYREVVVRQLHRLGCVVEDYRNGAEILQALDRDPLRYGLLVTDGHMPVLDGFALVRRLRDAPPPTRHPLPVILLSATTGIGDADTLDSQIAGTFFQKPVGLAALDAALKRYAPEIVAYRRTDAGVPPSAATPVPASVPDFNLAALAELLGTRDPLDLGPFCHSAVRALASLHERLAVAVARREVGPVTEIAHAAKGSAASAGADRLASLLQEIHGAAQDHRWARVDALSGVVATTHAAFAQAVATAFPPADAR